MRLRVRLACHEGVVILRRGDRVRAWVAPGVGVRETPSGPTWARGSRTRRVWMAATVVYTQGRGSVTVDCADGWRRMVPERYIRQLAIVRNP